MIVKCIAFLGAALTLSNCCALGNGCAPPSGASIAWGGPGAGPAGDNEAIEPRPNKHAGTKHPTILGPLQSAASLPNATPQPKDIWEQQQAAEQADEARLKRKLTICRACLTNGSTRDEETSSVTR